MNLKVRCKIEMIIIMILFTTISVMGSSIMFATEASRSNDPIDTIIEAWLDQDQNGANDSKEICYWGAIKGTYILRDYYTTYDSAHILDWSYARVRGQLLEKKALDEGGRRGVPDQYIQIYWGFGKTWQRTYGLRTDSTGMFSIDIPVSTNDPTGAVPLGIIYFPQGPDPTYNSSALRDCDGFPFTIASFTKIKIDEIEDLEKETNTTISGRLWDDRGNGVGNKTVDLYMVYDLEGHYRDPDYTPREGIKLGYGITDAWGNFVIRNIQVPVEGSPGEVSIIARFNGSEEYPYGPQGIRYLPDDCYLPSFSEPRKTMLRELPEILIDSPEKLTAGETCVIKGRLVESWNMEAGIEGRTLELHISQQDLDKVVGTTVTEGGDPDSRGRFSFEIDEVPCKLKVGSAMIRVLHKCDPSSGESDVFLPCENCTGAFICHCTHIAMKSVSPVDRSIPPDGRIDLNESDSDEWKFIFQVKDGDGSDPATDPIMDGAIWFNITTNDGMLNSTLLNLDAGEVVISFTPPLNDTTTGRKFNSMRDLESFPVYIHIDFPGDGGYLASSHTIEATYTKEVKADDEKIGGGNGEKRNPPTILLIGIIILVVALLLIAVLIFIIIKRRKESEEKKSEPDQGSATTDQPDEKSVMTADYWNKS